MLRPVVAMQLLAQYLAQCLLTYEGQWSEASIHNLEVSGGV